MMNPSPMILPNDLITEVLSILPVKSLLRFKCVSKHWRTLISNHAFVKLHLKRSKTRTPSLTLVIFHTTEVSLGGIDFDCSVVPYPIRSLLDNPSFTLFDDPYYHAKSKGCERIVGSCNGLILLAGTGYLTNFNHFSESKNIDNWFCLWNPATRTTSKNFGYYRAFGDSQCYNFAFGCDDLKESYKVVAYRYTHQFISQVRILNLDDDVWRKVESFPAVPIQCIYVYLSGTLNWLAVRNKDISAEKFVIVSLDLRTEAYNEFLLPRCFDDVLPRESGVLGGLPRDSVFGMLGGCLCFSYIYKKTDFVIWQMKQFGVEDSWTQFFKISLQNLQINYDYTRENNNKHVVGLMPLFLLDDTLILTTHRENHAILYNWRDKRVKRTNIIAHRTITREGTICYCDFLNWRFTKDYVESLVPIV